MAEDGYKVSLNVYDLSQGLARQLSSAFLGKAIEGVWHTGVVVYGNEYYFGGGIQHAPVGATPYGTPLRVVDLGVTHVPKELFEEYLQEISPRYTAETYSLLGHNCNNFSNEVAQFLVGTNIPDYILQLPNEVLSSPMGALIMPMIQQLETTLRAGAVPQTPQFQPSSSLVQPRQSTTMTANTTLNKSMSSNPSRSSTKTKDSKDENTSKEVCSTDDKEQLPVPETKSEKPEKQLNQIAGDRLGSARTLIQEEITREFAAIMATGTLRASEAAALAARRVMERHGRMNATMQQS